MTDVAPKENRGENKRGGMGRGGRGGAKGGRDGGRPKGDEWKPKTKLGRLVSNGTITSIHEVFKYSIAIKEPGIVDALVNKGGENKFQEEVMKVKPVQKQTKAGQRTRFKAWVLIGDGKGHIGLGQNADKEVQGAIKGGSLLARMSLIPVRLG